MNAEELLLSRWRDLPPEQQREVIDFTEFLAARVASSNESGNTLISPRERENDTALSRRCRSVPDLIESVRRRHRELPEDVEWLDSTASFREDRDGR
jgi:hypothetical protein